MAGDLHISWLEKYLLAEKEYKAEGPEPKVIPTLLKPQNSLLNTHYVHNLIWRTVPMHILTEEILLGFTICKFSVSPEVLWLSAWWSHTQVARHLKFLWFTVSQLSLEGNRKMILFTTRGTLYL